MAMLGDFGRALAEIDLDTEQDEFRFCGELFRVPSRLSPLPLMRFAWRQKVIQQASEQAERAIASAWDEAQRDRALADKQTADLDAMASMYEFVKSCLPDEAAWAHFELVAQRNAVDMDVLMSVCATLYAAVSGRPTQRPSDSSAGPSPSGAGSTATSVSAEPTAGPRQLRPDRAAIDSTLKSVAGY